MSNWEKFALKYLTKVYFVTSIAFLVYEIYKVCEEEKMKEIKRYKTSKYQDGSYEELDGGIYKKNEQFFVTLTFVQEPDFGEGKDASSISQYPLEDILDKFGVYISDFYKSENVAGNDTCYLEFASNDEKDLDELLTIVNKHVYNKNVIVEGEETVALIIE